MTTVVVVRKAGQVAIAADTLVTFGDTRLTHRFEANSKIFRLDTPAGPTYVGMAGTVAHFPVLRKALAGLPPEELRLSSKDEVVSVGSETDADDDVLDFDDYEGQDVTV